MPWVCLKFVIVVFPDNTHLLFLAPNYIRKIIPLDVKYINTKHCIYLSTMKKASVYDQETLQSHSADQPMAP